GNDNVTVMALDIRTNALLFQVQPKRYKISGTVTSNGRALAQVTVTGPGGQSVQTKPDGSYEFTVDAGSNILIAPSKSLYTFSFAPVDKFFYNVRADQTQDFTVGPPFFTTVFPLHGIGQTKAAMRDLEQSLTGQSGVGQPGR